MRRLRFERHSPDFALRDRTTTPRPPEARLVIQDLSLRYPDFVTRMVVFNTGLPFDRKRMTSMQTRAPADAGEYSMYGLFCVISAPRQRLTGAD